MLTKVKYSIWENARVIKMKYKPRVRRQTAPVTSAKAALQPMASSRWSAPLCTS